ncbi:MAG TPA: restriction endonuclease [Usitatibacteraceae bacterium]|nr:restriction endonuclease [Usitatibacteraceae bacterium]
MPRRPRDKDNDFLGLVTLLPWWLSLVLAVASYLLLHWYAGSKPDPASLRVGAPGYGTDILFRTLAIFGQYLFPLIFVMAAIVSGLRTIGRRATAGTAREEPIWRSDRRDALEGAADPYQEWTEAGRHEPASPVLDTSRFSPELLKALDWKRFELLCAAYFEKIGFRAQTTAAGPDGGVDIHLFAKDAERAGIVVQCKAWRNVPVGVALVRELLGVMTAAGVKEGIVATVGTFTAEARAFAAGQEIHLIDGEDFLAKIAALEVDAQLDLLVFATEGDFTTPTCPSCGIGHRMRLRTSGKDGTRFWGCGNFPRCRATMQVGR